MTAPTRHEMGSASPRPKAPLKLTPREEARYSLSRGLLEDAAARLENRKPASFEHDVSEQLSREMQDYHGGLVVPLSMRAGLDTATATKGQELKFPEGMPWLDMLRVESVVMRAGATFVDGLVGGPVAFPRLSTQTLPVWAAQNPLADQAQNDSVWGQVAMNPKSIYANTAYSKQLLRQSQVVPNNSIDRVLALDIARAHGALIDAAAVGGTGAGNQPTGVATQLSGGQLIAFGANGLQPGWANMVDIEAAAAVANVSGADTDDTDLWPKPINAWVSTPQIKQRLRKTDRSGGTSGWMILGDEGRTKLMGCPFYVSNSVPSNLTKGTSSGICHAIVYGRWSDLFIGQWGPGIELVTDPFTKKAQGMVGVASYQLIDIAVARVGSFAGALDALP